MHRCAGGLWLQGHNERASLLYSVGKIFHCVHYSSAATRMLRKDPDTACLSIGAPLEPRGTWNLEGGSYTGEIERWRALGTGHLSSRVSIKGTLKGGSFTEEPERYVKQGSEMGVCFHRGPAFGEHGGAILSWSILI